MAHALSLNPDPNKVRDTSVAAIAEETETSVDIVKALFDEQVTALGTKATVKQYIAVIAAKLVKQQLRVLGRAH